MNKTHTMAAWLCLAASQLHAQDELPPLVSVAHRMETGLADFGGSLTLFEKEEIELMGSPFTQDILRWAPGMAITRTGGPGQASQLYTRGMESRHTLILVDGMEIRNTNSPTGYDLVHLPAGNIERIEILRGPQSTLYGADAMGGVINIVTRKGEEAKQVETSFSTGSHNTFSGSLSASGKEGKLSYFIHTMAMDSEGFSVARNGAEEDPYENRNLSATLGYQLSDNLDLHFVVRHLETETQYDNAAFMDAPGYFSTQQDSAFQLGLTTKSGDGIQKDRVTFGYKAFGQKNNSFGTEDFSSQTAKAEWLHTFRIGDSTTLLSGIEVMEEQGEQELDYGFGVTEIEETLRTTSGFLHAMHQFSKDFNMDVSGRLDDSRTWGSKGTWRATANYLLGKSTRLKGSAGTGFKAPNAYYLANAEDRTSLEPEESIGFDVGIEQHVLDGKATFEVIFFDNDIEHLYGWDPSSYKVENIDMAKTRGIETSLSWIPGEGWKLLWDWTYMETEDLSTGHPLDFRPENQWGARLYWTPVGQNFSTFLGVRHRSKMYNSTFSTNMAQNPSPSGDTWEVSARYNLSERSTIFLKAEDLFDQGLEEMRDYYGNPYAVPGRTFLAGITLRL